MVDFYRDVVVPELYKIAILKELLSTVTCSCKSDTFSEVRAISSAKRRSGMTTPLTSAPPRLLSRAIAMTASKKMIKSSGESTQPCKIPTMVLREVNSKHFRH